jgi:hypothetical protein
VIQHPEEQDDVERADALGGQVHHVDVDILDLGPERLAGELEAGLRAPAVGVPRVVVRGDDPRRTASFALEGKKAIPGADIEHRPMLERRRERQAREACGGVVGALRDQATPEVDGVVPPMRGHSGPEGRGSDHL